jgi:tRNA(Ser,Leu) C12 N-acetylase TAN1
MSRVATQKLWSEPQDATTSLRWNVVATAKNLEQRHLARRLKRLGDFWWTPFLGVLVGRVEDHQAFFEQLQRQEDSRPGFLAPLSKLVPVERTFPFTVETLPLLLRDAVGGYAEQIDSGLFYVRVERRGHAGEIHSQTLEQELDRTLIEMLKERGAEPHVNFKDPDVIIAIEIVGDECGVGLITRGMRERFPFVKVP